MDRNRAGSDTRLWRTIVLLVCDHEEARARYERCLAGDGVLIVSATSAEGAFEILRPRRVALTIIDMALDDEALGDLAKRVQEERPGSSSVLVLGDRPLDAFDVVMKPVDDTTLRTLAAERLRWLEYKQNAELNASRRLVFRAAMIAHELRNPLVAIACTNDLLQRTPLSDKQRELVEQVQSAAVRLKRIADDLCDGAHAHDAGALSISPTSGTRISSIVHAAVATLPPTSRGRIAFEDQAEAVGTWDSDRLIQMMTNLLDNAVRHGERDSPIEISTHTPSSSWVRISVTNQGEIPAAWIETIWEPFSVGSDNPFSLGLGLSIVRQIVTGHGGSVDLRTDVGMTTFVVDLPTAG